MFKDSYSVKTNLKRLFIQQYERYLPTAFDESMTLLEKMNKLIESHNAIIDVVNTHVEFTSDQIERAFDIIDDNLARQLQQFRDELEEQTTLYEELRDQMYGDLLPDTVKQKLEEWLLNGTIKELIEDTVFPEWLERLYIVENKLNNIINSVKEYGAVGDGVTDDTLAIKEACSVIQENGGGTLYFPNGIYKFNGVVDEFLYHFKDLDYFKITGDNAVLKDVSNYNRDTLETSGFLIFEKSNNVNIDNGVNFTSQDYDLDSNEAYSGISWFDFIDGCNNVNVDTMISGGNSGVKFDNMLSGLNLRYSKSKNIRVNLIAEHIRYPFVSRWGLDNADVKLDISECGRPFFLYGSDNVNVNVKSKNTGTSLIKSYSGHGCKNIKVFFKDTESNTTRYTGSGELLSIHFGDQTPALMKNIDIEFDVKNYDDGWGHTLTIDKFLNGGTTPDTEGRGHVLDGLKVSGYSVGVSGRNHLSIARGEFKNPDVFKNINIENFKMLNAGSINLRLRDSLEGTFNVSNTISQDGNISIANDTGIVFYEKCKASNFTAAAGNESRHHYSNSETIYPNNNNHINKTYSNTLINGEVINRSDLRYVPNKYDKTIVSKIFGSTDNVGTKETVLINNEDIHYDLLQTGHQFPRIYKLLIGSNSSNTRAMIDSKIVIIPDGAGGITDVKLIGTPDVTNILGDNVTSESLTVENDNGRIKVILTSTNQMAFAYIHVIIKEEF